jgi:hypothetical protein
MVVFAGDLGPGLAGGTPVELPAPAIMGLPCARMLWTLTAPRGMLLRVGEPARVVDGAALAAERAAAEARLAADFERAMATLDVPDRDRLQEYLRSRGESAAARPGAAWEQAAIDAGLPRWPSEPAVGVVMDSNEGYLTLRAFRQRDPTVPTRAIATLLTLLLGGTALAVVRRGPAAWTLLNAWAAPAAAGVVGIAWMWLLQPALPGGLLAFYGFAAMAAEWRRFAPPPKPGQPIVAADVVIAQSVAAGDSEG